MDHELQITALENQIHDFVSNFESTLLTLARSLLSAKAAYSSQTEKSEKASQQKQVKQHVDVLTPPDSPQQTEAQNLDEVDSSTDLLKTTSIQQPQAVQEVILPQSESRKTSLKIIEILQSYGQHLSTTDDEKSQHTWAGTKKFLPMVEKYVEAGQTVKMILPAFPWKSINRVEKTLGPLPDLGEELALARLHNLCQDISQVYEHGAQLTLATDGLVFDDLVGITDEDTWEYGEALMAMASSMGYDDIKLVRVQEILGLNEGRPLTKEFYLQTAEECRKVLAAQFGKADEVIRDMIQNDEDSCITYRGFIKFLELDLKFSPGAAATISGSQYRKHVKKVAMGMMARAESFTKIIQAKLGDYVRLSIHPSSGAVKLSVPLIPQVSGGFPKSPWHCSITVGVDGSFKTVHAKDVSETHDLVYQNDRPYFFREKSPLYEWLPNLVSLEHSYSKGLVVRAVTSQPCVLGERELKKLQQLTLLQPQVHVENFTNFPDGRLTPEMF